MNSAVRPSRAGLLALMFFSGVAGLGYQMTWVRLFSAGLGHEVPAMVSVIGAFLGGMALGAWALDRRIATSANPRLWFARLELIIGGWGFVSAWLIPHANGFALDRLGVQPSAAWHWTVVFLLPFATLLPSTLAMGATLPAMERFFRPHSDDGRCVGAVYSANTFGAVAGTLGSTFLLMPALGLRGTLLVLAVVNVGVGLGVLRLGATQQTAKPSPRPAAPAGDISTTRLAATVFVTGFLGIGFELVGIRGLAQVLENTAFTYAAVLAVFLVGTAVGAAVYQRVLRHCSARPTLNWLLCGLSLACLLAGWALSGAQSIYHAARGQFGDSLGAVMLAEVAAAVAVFGLPTVLMGSVFGLLVQSASGPGGGVGRALAWNTLGCCGATVAVTLWILPGFGLRGALVVLALGYLPLMAPAWRRQWWLPALPLALALFYPKTIQLLRVPDGAEIVEQREGVLANVAVVKSADGHRTLRVNTRLQMGGTASAIAQQREAHLPLLLHPDPRTALFLGPGTGITLGATEAYPDLTVTGVELLPEVRNLMRHFEPENGGPFPSRRVDVLVADARRFIRTTTNRYDVIVADVFHPAQDGAGFLYTKEHFEAARQRLANDGIFCQWLPLHQLDTPTLRIIARTFTEVFSETRAFLLHFNVDIPVLGLIGSREPLDLDPARFERRLSDGGLRAALRGVGLDRPFNLLGCFAGGPRFLRDFAREGVVATDLRPAVLFAAPRFSVRRDVSSYAVLLDWLDRARAGHGELLELPALRRDAAYAASVGDFLRARDGYLRGLAREGEGDLPGAIDLYLESTRQSLYFIPAYARLVTVVQVMARAERSRAHELWLRLEQARPDQPLGRQLLGPIFDANPPVTTPQ